MSIASPLDTKKVASLFTSRVPIAFKSKIFATLAVMEAIAAYFGTP